MNDVVHPGPKVSLISKVLGDGPPTPWQSMSRSRQTVPCSQQPRETQTAPWLRNTGFNLLNRNNRFIFGGDFKKYPPRSVLRVYYVLNIITNINILFNSFCI